MVLKFKMNTDEYKVRPDLHLSIIHNWPLNLLVWCCGLYSEGKGLISIPESAQVSGLHKVHLSFKMNVENVEGKSVRRRKVGRDVSKLITFTARCQRCYKPNEVNDRSEDMFKVTNINTKKNSVSY